MSALEDILLTDNGANIESQPISEYRLITKLQKPPYSLFDSEALREPLAMFRCHFVLFHHLYQLQNSWIKQGKGKLTIHTTKIVLTPLKPSQHVIELPDPLRDYYLDWQNFDKTNTQDVEDLLDSFWQKMASDPQITSPQDKQSALSILELTEPFELKTLKQAYRAKQHQHHPDKGGDAGKSKQLQWAYYVLKREFHSQ
ncbi:DNA-J related domain-containing protein [Aliiglaciecola lipolytica]|uniref:DNA-J related domain-containing protein n=1 Tax=Aliiglaciecola lipolytica TaxID=477689 RepID=UPI0002FA6827|nr:DNA-J related domain-containing protein [Aliiglaciecola lipolytica]